MLPEWSDDRRSTLRRNHLRAGRTGSDRQVGPRSDPGRTPALAVGEARGVEIGEARGVEIGEARGIEIGEARGVEIGEARGRRSTLLAIVAVRWQARLAELEQIDDIDALEARVLELLGGE